MIHATHLTDCELVTEVGRLAQGEREATVALIVHLGEFDNRRLGQGAGFSSTFGYCMKVLRLSEDAAINRIRVARMARRYPVVVDMLTTGALSPTTARMLARRVTPESHDELFAAASGKSKQEVEELLARLFPEPDVAPRVRKLPTANPLPVPVTPPSSAAVEAVTPSRGGRVGSAPREDESGPGIQACDTVLPPPTSIPRPVVRPLAAERYEIRFTASAEMHEKLRLAQDLLGHAIPGGDLAQVFDRALTLLLEDLQRKKFAATNRPRASRGQSEESRNIPAAVRRAVWARDAGRCAFVSSGGRRCGERRFVQFHHVQPYGARGKPTIGNIQLRCGAHNRYEAELFYGPGRRYAGGDVVSEPMAVYGSAPHSPVPGRVLVRRSTPTPTAGAGRSSV
jgi:hypothetical protein